MIYLFPTEREAAPFRAARADACLVICGVGMAATAATLSSLISRGEEIVLAGIAGSYDTERVPIGSVVEVVSERVVELPERFVEEYRVEPRWSLAKVDSATVSGCGATPRGAQIENMEGAAAFAISLACGVPLSQIRAISNRVGDPFEMWDVEGAIEALTQTLLTI